MDFEPSDAARNDFEIIAEAVAIFLEDHNFENVHIRPCHVEPLGEDEEYEYETNFSKNTKSPRRG